MNTNPLELATIAVHMFGAMQKPAELDLTIQDFMEKLLLAKLPKVPEPTDSKEING